MRHVEKPASAAGGELSGRFRNSRILVVAAVFLLAACDIKYRAFEPLNPAPLEGQLELGKAQRSDV